MPLSVGDKLSHYEVSLLGQGGMGEVYKARDTRSERKSVYNRRDIAKRWKSRP
jgi:hypothetical protein